MSENRRPSARRSLPSQAPVVKAESNYQSVHSLTFITPMFGGGVSTDAEEPHRKRPDVHTLVRGASLRGQLRFWWRVTCGAKLALPKLIQRESELWGWASTDDHPAKGRVSLAVNCNKLSAWDKEVYRIEKRRTRLVDGMAELSYACFPLQPDKKDEKKIPGVLTELRGSFTVTLTLDTHRAPPSGRSHAELWEEVKIAWLAFVTFGGLGGRTRRGFGALREIHTSPNTAAPVSCFNTILKTLGWSDRVHIKKLPRATVTEAHKHCIRRLRDFRQKVFVGRNLPKKGSGSPAGRSRWPEPDSIRRLTGDNSPRHPPEHPVDRAFPRAAFGLPIIFHFKDTDDPKDHTLKVSADRERLASPLVLKPVQTRDGKIYAVALQLPQREDLNTTLQKIELKGQDSHKVRGTLTAAEQDLVQPLTARRTKPSAGVDAVYEPFFNYFKS